MTGSSRASPPVNAPVVAVLTTRWETSTEEGWITRQVAGALANVADVHILTTGGVAGACTSDSVFAVHHLGLPIERSSELRRDLLIEALSQTGMTGRLSPGLQALVDRGLVRPWQDASRLLATLRPDVILIAGHQNVGGLAAVDEFDPEAPVLLLALGSNADSLRFPRFEPVFERASSVLAVTELERQLIASGQSDPTNVHRIGAPLAANTSALTEPNPWVGSTAYVLVLSAGASYERSRAAELSRLVRVRFPDEHVGLVHTDAFSVWHRGRNKSGWPIERSSDMARLLAFARMMIDLRPGRLFARQSVESLLYGTPIVIPHDSRSREHAERGKGGLWFDGPAELTWCIEAMLDPVTRDAFGAQGRSYAEEEYGSTNRFIDRVIAACGLPATGSPVEVTA